MKKSRRGLPAAAFMASAVQLASSRLLRAWSRKILDERRATSASNGRGGLFERRAAWSGDVELRPLRGQGEISTGPSMQDFSSRALRRGQPGGEAGPHAL